MSNDERSDRQAFVIRHSSFVIPMPSFSDFAQTVTVEGAFGVLAVAKQLKAQGKRVIELEIGDSPFPSTPAAKEAGLAAVRTDESHYCPSLGLPEFREAAADLVSREF